MTSNLIGSWDEGNTQGIHNSQTRYSLNDVKLYLKAENDLNTITPANNTPLAPMLLDDDEEVVFTMSQALFEDIELEATVHGGENTFEIQLYLTISPTTVGSATITLMDDAIPIARSTFPQGEINSDPKYLTLISENAPDKIYHLKEGHRLQLKINVTITSPLGQVVLNYGSPTFSSHIVLTTYQIFDDGGETLDSLGQKTASFQPNLPDDMREIKVKAWVEDAFGYLDISRVIMEVYDPSNLRIFESNMTIYKGGNEQTCTADYQWEYQAGYPAGTYVVRANFYDHSENLFQVNITFEMSEYGLILECSEPGRDGIQGKSTEFNVTVRNIGGEDDIYTFSVSVSPDEWVLNYVSSLSVAAGKSEILLIKVTVPSDSQEGDRCHIDVSGRSKSDTSISYNLPYQLTVTTMANFDFELIPPGQTTQEVEKGETAIYGLSLSNIGQKVDSYELSLPQPEADWRTWLEGDGLELQTDENLYPRKYLIVLEMGDKEDLVLKVKAPENPTTNNREQTVLTVKSQNNTENVKELSVTTTTKGAAQEQLWLLCQESKKSTTYDVSREEYEPVTYVVDIHNDGFEDWTVDISHSGEPSGWFVDYKQNVVIPQGESVSLEVSIQPDPEALADDDNEGEKIAITATVMDIDPAVSSGISLYTVVEQYYSLGFVLRETSEKTRTVSEAGKSLSYVFNVVNQGNARDRVFIDVKDDSDWDVELSRKDLTLEPGSSGTFTLTLISPDTIKNGDEKEIDVSITSDGDSTQTQKISLGISVDISFSQRFFSALKDSVLTIVFFLSVLIIFAGALIYSKKRQL